VIVGSAERRGGAKQVAITFDDGPSRWTAEILNTFRAHAARATFFVLGERVGGAEGVLLQAVRDGHELGNHTFTHPRCSKLDAAELADELERTQARIERAVGARPRIVRPPHGDGPDAVDAAAVPLGLAQTVLWSVDPEDWREPPAETIAEHVLNVVEPGAIVLLHDGFSSHESPHHNTRQATVDAVRLLVPELIAAGYELVTVSELLRA
jgi:peptidoglycan/xylan/chitin deacetylase (PgdA/CDA1 family)